MLFAMYDRDRRNGKWKLCNHSTSKFYKARKILLFGVSALQPKSYVKIQITPKLQGVKSVCVIGMDADHKKDSPSFTEYSFQIDGPIDVIEFYLHRVDESKASLVHTITITHICNGKSSTLRQWDALVTTSHKYESSDNGIKENQKNAVPLPIPGEKLFLKDGEKPKYSYSEAEANQLEVVAINKSVKKENIKPKTNKRVSRSTTKKNSKIKTKAKTKKESNVKVSPLLENNKGPTKTIEKSKRKKIAKRTTNRKPSASLCGLLLEEKIHPDPQEVAKNTQEPAAAHLEAVVVEANAEEDNNPPIPEGNYLLLGTPDAEPQILEDCSKTWSVVDLYDNQYQNYQLGQFWECFEDTSLFGIK